MTEKRYTAEETELLWRARKAREILRYDPGVDPVELLAAVVWGKGAPVFRKKAA